MEYKEIKKIDEKTASSGTDPSGVDIYDNSEFSLGLRKVAGKYKFIELQTHDGE